MSQHDGELADQVGSLFLPDLNAFLAAILSNSSGASAPSVMYAYMWWCDTSTGLLKQRNAANSGWITIGTLASTNLGLLSLAGGTLTGDLSVPDEAYDATAWNGNLEVPTKNAIRDKLEALTSVPAGTIIDFAGASAPSGYLECPLVATNISRTTYADLFAAIGTLWGAGDGSTTFGMPYFPQDYAGIHTTGTTGVSSTGTVKAHTHTITGGTSAGATGVEVSTTAAGALTENTASTGGAGNLAAGMRIRKCVKI